LTTVLSLKVYQRNYNAWKTQERQARTLAFNPTNVTSPQEQMRRLHNYTDWLSATLPLRSVEDDIFACFIACLLACLCVFL
jgi:hypothetical protein